MTKIAAPKNALPKGLTVADLQSPDWKDAKDIPYEQREFELWFTTGFGWCIPTLDISNSRRAGTRRTYAVTVDGGKVVRIGAGPHVLETLIVYSRTSRRAALQPFFDLREKGASGAGVVRDRISSRRAQGQIERMNGRSYWRWDV